MRRLKVFEQRRGRKAAGERPSLWKDGFFPVWKTGNCIALVVGGIKMLICFKGRRTDIRQKAMELNKKFEDLEEEEEEEGALFVSGQKTGRQEAVTNRRDEKEQRVSIEEAVASGEVQAKEILRLWR